MKNMRDVDKCMINKCTTTFLYTCMDTSIVGVPDSVPSPLVCPAVGEELPAEDGSAESEGEVYSIYGYGENPHIPGYTHANTHTHTHTHTLSTITTARNAHWLMIQSLLPYCCRT